MLTSGATEAETLRRAQLDANASRANSLDPAQAVLPGQPRANAGDLLQQRLASTYDTVAGIVNDLQHANSMALNQKHLLIRQANHILELQSESTSTSYQAAKAATSALYSSANATHMTGLYTVSQEERMLQAEKNRHIEAMLNLLPLKQRRALQAMSPEQLREAQIAGHTSRTHHREKPDMPQNRARGNLSPHSVLEKKKKKA